MGLFPKKKYKVTKETFIEMLVTVIYVDTWLFDYEGYWNNKFDFNGLLSEDEFITITDKYKEMAIVFAYITAKEFKIYEENMKELFLSKIKQFFKEEKYSMFKYKVIEDLIDKFEKFEFKEKDINIIYEYWINDISKQYNIITEEKLKELKKIIELINFQIIRKVNRLYEETKIKK